MLAPSELVLVRAERFVRVYVKAEELTVPALESNTPLEATAVFKGLLTAMLSEFESSGFARLEDRASEGTLELLNPVLAWPEHSLEHALAQMLRLACNDEHETLELHAFVGLALLECSGLEGSTERVRQGLAKRGLGELHGSRWSLLPTARKAATQRLEDALASGMLELTRRHPRIHHRLEDALVRWM